MATDSAIDAPVVEDQHGHPLQWVQGRELRVAQLALHDLDLLERHCDLFLCEEDTHPAGIGCAARFDDPHGL